MFALKNACRHVPLLTGLLTTLLLWPISPAKAASDGYYCAGHNYFAYQFDAASTMSGSQILFVVPLDPNRGMGETRRISLESFQVLGMRCLDDAVDLLSWNRIYRVNLQDGRTGLAEPQPEDSIFPDFTNDNLGRWASPARIVPLKTRAGRFSFDLVIDLSPASSQQRVTSRLQQKDGKKIVSDREIFSGLQAKTTD